MANSALTVMKCLLLLAFLNLCTGALTPAFELALKARERQKEYKEIWNGLIQDGEIIVTTRQLKSGPERPLYKFTGKRVMERTLDEILSMLQNLQDIRIDVYTDNFFVIPIGGEDFTFRLRNGRHRQILVYDERGKLEKYRDIQTILDHDASKVADLAKQMHNSLNEPLAAQSTWTESDANVKKKMKLLLVLTQVAEAAPPPEEILNKVKEIMIAEDMENKAVKRHRRSKPKNGRMPGFDVLAQNALELMSQGKYSSFKEFLGILPSTKTAQKGRETWFKHNAYKDLTHDPKGREDLSKKRKATEDLSKKRKATDEDLPKKRRKIDPEAVALSDAKESEIIEAIKKPPGCNSRRRKKRSPRCNFRLNDIVPDSIELHEDHLAFDTHEEGGRRRHHEVRLNPDRASVVDYIKERIANLHESGVLEETGKAIAKYAAVVNTIASINYFSHGEIGKGTFSAFQAVHGFGGLTGANDALSIVTKKALRKLITATAEKVLSKRALQQLSKVGERLLEKSTAKIFKRFAGTLPGVGLALDFYFVREDVLELKNKNNSVPKALKVTHLVIDVTITFLSLVETGVPILAPYLELFNVALTIVRLGLDDFYLDIKEELSKVKGRGFASHVAAFVLGASEGLGDFLTLGLGRQIRLLKKQQALDREQLRNMSNPVSYFNVTIQGVDSDNNEEGTLIDFSAGMYSQFGGFLTVKLNENGSITVQLPEVPTESGVQTQVTKTFSFRRPATDIVLGVGQVTNPVYRKEEAKLWLLFNWEDRSVIDHFENHPSSQYGSYYGNSRDNTFFALQGKTNNISNNTNNDNNNNDNNNNNRIAHKQRNFRKHSNCPKTDSITLRLQSYHYDLHGREGNDRFFLGPQSSLVAGGDDNDIYYIPASGGRATIDNFAHDEEMDTLFLNVSFSDIVCTRNGWDLVITYCQTHAAKIRNWFSHGLEFHRHIYIHTADGIVVEANKTDLHDNQYRIKCVAVAIDKSQSSSGQDLVLSGSFAYVKQVIGSNYSDSIIGNQKANVLNGGKSGNDRLEGMNGPDAYIVEEGSGLTKIVNFAEDNEIDALIFNIPYTNIGVERDNFNLLLYDSLHHNSTKVIVSNWFSRIEWQHMRFTSRDLIQFAIMEDDDGVVRKHPFIIDLSGSEEGVYLNLAHPNSSRNIAINSEVAKEVKTVYDSPHDDTVIGNALSNFFDCSGGSDTLEGRGGQDTYVVKKTCKSLSINNHDPAEDYDMLLLKCNDSSLTLQQSLENLVITCALGSRSLDIRLTNWFHSSNQRHLIVKTADKISSFLPETTSELSSLQRKLLPFQVESDEDCGGAHKVIDLTIPRFQRCEGFVAKTDACSYSIIGNSLDNHIDPGPGNPYGYQHLTGGNGTDTYVIGHRYGLLNVIDNSAEDDEVDNLNFKVLFHDIDISLHETDIILHSLNVKDSVKVNIRRYFQGETYQHLLVHSADGVSFKLVPEFPYIEVIKMDFSKSQFSQIIQAHHNSKLEHTRKILGSKTAENYIEGGQSTAKIVGGLENDTIIGGPGGGELIGLDGSDVINGGLGNDVLYGGDGDDTLIGGPGDDVFHAGMGADSINGTSGSNTIIFSGYNFTGVIVDLQFGMGWKADAEGDTYDVISNVIGSVYA